MHNCTTHFVIIFESTKASHNLLIQSTPYLNQNPPNPFFRSSPPVCIHPSKKHSGMVSPKEAGTPAPSATPGSAGDKIYPLLIEKEAFSPFHYLSEVMGYFQPQELPTGEVQQFSAVL